MRAVTTQASTVPRKEGAATADAPGSEPASSVSRSPVRGSRRDEQEAPQSSPSQMSHRVATLGS